MMRLARVGSFPTVGAFAEERAKQNCRMCLRIAIQQFGKCIPGGAMAFHRALPEPSRAIFVTIDGNDDFFGTHHLLDRDKACGHLLKNGAGKPSREREFGLCGKQIEHERSGYGGRPNHEAVRATPA